MYILNCFLTKLSSGSLGQFPCFFNQSDLWSFKCEEETISNTESWLCTLFFSLPIIPWSRIVDGLYFSSILFNRCVRFLAFWIKKGDSCARTHSKLQIELDSKFPCFCSLFHCRWRKTVGRAKNVSLMFLPHFDVFSDKLLSRSTVKQNIFVLWYKETTTTTTTTTKMAISFLETRLQRILEASLRWRLEVTWFPSGAIHGGNLQLSILQLIFFKLN